MNARYAGALDTGSPDTEASQQSARESAGSRLLKTERQSKKNYKKLLDNAGIVRDGCSLD
jgi:hypothetical protein